MPQAGACDNRPMLRAPRLPSLCLVLIIGGSSAAGTVACDDSSPGDDGALDGAPPLDDADGDGIGDDEDLCPFVANDGPCPAFGNAQPVAMTGYPSDAYREVMEPFVSRDGRYLFFNTGPSEARKDLLYGEWNGDRSELVFGGGFTEVNTPDRLEANPTIDSAMRLYYIDESAAPNWVRGGSFDPATGELQDLAQTPGPPALALVYEGDVIVEGTVNMGVDVSADGDTLYFSRATFTAPGQPSQVIVASDILFATRQPDGSFSFDETAARHILQTINTDEELEYAACISHNELEFYFTRLTASSIPTGTPDSQIMRATRASRDEPFGEPQPVEAIANHVAFVEAPTIFQNELYYHQLDGQEFRLYRVTR